MQRDPAPGPSATLLRVLVVEDSEADAVLIVHELERVGYEVVWERVQTAEAMRTALHRATWDIVLSDFDMPAFSGPAALDVLKHSGHDLPFLIISGTVGEATAVAALKAGARDFLVKNHLARLAPAIERELGDVAVRREHRRTEEALHQSEAQYRSLVERVIFGIYQCTINGRFLTVNPALVKMLRYTSADELLAISVNDLYVDAGVLDALLARTRQHGLITAENVRWQPKTGPPIRVRLSGCMISVAGSEAPVLDVIVEDITERIRLEEQLRQSQKMDAVGQLAGGIAHDFNNILTAIQGYTTLLLESFEDDDVRYRDVHEIEHAAERAAGLTRQLLAFSRKQMLDLRVMSVSDMVQGIQSMLRRLVDETIDVTTIAKSKGHVKADPGQLQQVLVNLVVNARDAIGSGGRITIETSDVTLDADYAREHPSAVPGPHVMLAVSDTGHGMSAETQARVFEPFFTTKPFGHGTGLGLSTVYGIVKQSGGHVWVYSEVGHGTTFKVYVPATEESPPVVVAARTAPHAQGSATVLLLEDEDGVRRLVVRVLQRYGYTVHATSRPAEALELAARHDIALDLLLTDVVLPDMNGQAVATKIVALHPQCRVLYMSGYTDEAIVRHGVLDPDAAFLQKPFMAAALVQKVEEVLAS